MTTRMPPLSPSSSASRESWEQYSDNDESDGRLDGSYPLPAGFPEHAAGPMVWSGADGTVETDLCVVDLESAALHAALESFFELELDGDEVSRERFPLPKPQRLLLERCAHEIHYGTGLCIIRGIDPERYSDEDQTILFLAIASYLGNHRGVQNAKGDMLTHVTDSKSWTLPQEKRHGIHGNKSMAFHNDMGTEILSVQVRDDAAIDGQTCVASLGAVYNHLRNTAPWVIRVLAQCNWPVQVSRKGSERYILCPLLEFHAGNLMISVDPARIGPYPSKLPGDGTIPSLTPEQEKALALLQQAASEHQVRLETRPGDLIFLNNWALLHAREAYMDDESSSRHLVRLWLRNDKMGWDIPSTMRRPWDASFGERAEAVTVRNYPPVPLPDYIQPKWGNGTAAYVPEDE